MGKENEIWDDSALINAFDQAMSKYKAMHQQGDHSKDIKTRHANERDEAGEVDEVLSTGPDAVNSSVSNIVNEPCEPAATEHPPVQEDHVGAVPELRDIGTNMSGVSVQENLGDSNSSSLEHTQLLKQYYELEHQRQKILMLLQQANSGYYYTNPEDSASCVPWTQSSTSQGNGALMHDPSHMSYFQSYDSNPCPCLGAPSWVPPCVLGGRCVEADSANFFSAADDNIAKVAMGAAEKAFSSMKMKAPPSSSSCKGKQEGPDVRPESEMFQNTTSSTDLTEVLNAWYSAGFYTGKYLVEQSITKGKS
ncbi:hypothetical protein H6P81_005380 [Aristolochia fimbriata]|uniref:Survival Motor Neuron Gemin2-binding domain-containing protein n=1 Tax=Aristolochia fimbriata TaxID=158543 RepID=A0AAV7EY03_ARIFI|nr:hypothetical protein H6P81_005380 [Aristolochia fimbriata]